MLRGEERKKIKKKQIRKVKQRQIKITAVGKEQQERQKGINVEKNNMLKK